MFVKTANVLVLLVGIASSVLGAPAHAQTASSPDQKLNALAAAIRAVTGPGLFAEEYDAILEAAQDNPHLRQMIIEHGPPK
jgi:hypothetical protein